MGESVTNSEWQAKGMIAKDAYSRAEVARILDIPADRIDYWARKNLVEVQGSVSGRNRFDFRALANMKKLISLRAHGISLQHICKKIAWVRETVPELCNPVSALKASCRETGEIVISHGGMLLDDFGQLCLSWDENGPEVEELVDPLETRSQKMDQAFLLFERACELEDNPKYLDEALEAYQLALEIDPEFSDAHCNLGTHFYNRGALDRALYHYELAIKTDEWHLEARFNLGNLLEERGENQRALLHYRRAAEIDPFFPDLALNLALLYEKLDFMKNARRQWKQYLSLCPKGHWADVARKRVIPQS